jgi:uncharacterized membrane protein YeaQ/YmgE (transglycosylase-associated protein family)
MFWNILVTLLIGALSGWLAGKLMHVKGGFWFNAILGIAGSFVGFWLAGLIGITASKVSIGGVLLSVLGACVVIWLVRVITGKKK